MAMKTVGALLLAFGMCVPAGRAIAEGDEGPTPEAIKAAVDKAVSFLKTKQDKEGSWGEIGASVLYGGAKEGKGYGDPCGPTAWSLYALLASGVPKDDAVVKKGFAYLDKTLKAGGAGPSAYETSAMLLATTARAGAPLGWRRGDLAKLDAGDRTRAQGLVDGLLAMRKASNAAGWRYDLKNQKTVPGGPQDLSSTGLAALALFSADRCGVKVPTDLWIDLQAYARSQQEDSGAERDRTVDEGSIDLAAKAAPPAPAPGQDAPKSKDRARGFSYIKSDTLEADEGQASGGVTACGIAVIEIARFLIGKRGGKAWNAAEQASAKQSLLDGCAWLDANWDARKNPKKTKTNLFHLFYINHVADAMDLVGSARLGAHAWYAELGQSLLQMQSEKGSWDTNSTHSPRDVLDTSFALLFFARPFGPPRLPAGGK